jgi:hypothetical protein
MSGDNIEIMPPMPPMPPVPSGDFEWIGPEIRYQIERALEGAGRAIEGAGRAIEGAGRGVRAARRGVTV